MSNRRKCANLCNVWLTYPGNIYLLKLNNINIRQKCKICSKLIIKTLERRQLRRSGVLIVNFENIERLFLVFLLLTLNIKYSLGSSLAEKKCIFKVINKNSTDQCTEYFSESAQS